MSLGVTVGVSYYFNTSANCQINLQIQRTILLFCALTPEIGSMIPLQLHNLTPQDESLSCIA